MDIRKWLDETVLPEQPPSPPGQLDLTPFLYREPRSIPKQNGRRKRSMSDSSLLDAHPRRKKALLAEPRSGIEDCAGESACSDASHATGWSSSGDSMSSQPYARRPRRKTRPDRYEPSSKKVKERGTHVHGRRKDESRKMKRKSRRKKANKPGSGIVQSFHAKNVPRDRLTLKPPEKLGLFNKGRASSPVKGRGLPDLVFSEMKFLQKHKGQPDPAPQSGVSKRKGKKGHAHAKEEDISAYFISARPALAERDVNTQAKEGASKRARRSEVDRVEREQSLVVDNAIATVELPDKASYLGFGGRGPRRGSGSYISWSESVQAPSATPICAQAGSTVNMGQLDSMSDRRDSGNSVSGDVLHSRAAPRPVTRNSTDGIGERFQVTSSAPANHRVSRSHSLPLRTSSPQPRDFVNRTLKRRTTEIGRSPSSMPRGKGSIGDRHHHTHIEGAKYTALSGQKPDSFVSQEGFPEHESNYRGPSNIEPGTFSSLGRILQECNSAFSGRRQAMESSGSNTPQIDAAHVAHRKKLQPGIGHYPNIQGIPSVRFAGVEICSARMPNFSGQSIYEQQAQEPHFTAQQYFNENKGEQEAYLAEHEYLEEDEDVDFDEQEWVNQLEETLPYELGDETLAENIIEPHQVEHAGQNFEQGDNVVARGFWRPNKLY